MPLSDPYLPEFESVARRAFGMWNREPASPTFGSFDRAHWGWKQRDFSDATLQYAARLAIAFAERSGQTATLPRLLEGFVDFCASIQWGDGSFDQCYPHERTPGVVHDILSTLVLVRKSPHLDSERARQKLDAVLRRAAAFTLRTDEHHGEIANHLAEYAFELLNYAAYAGDERAHARGLAYVDRLLAQFDANEGWFREYEGPDAGYQTRTLRYLVKCARLLDDGELWKVARQAMGFLEYLVMPDGSLHAMLGTRSTALLYPSAFEVMAQRDPALRPLAGRIRSAWRQGLVPLPSWLDFDNAIRLADDALEASTARQEEAAGASDTAAGSSHAAAAAITELHTAGITIVRGPSRVVYVAHRLGGVVVVYDRQLDGRWQLTYEDSGYLLRSGGKVWLSRMPGAGVLEESSDQRLALRAVFHRSIHDELTPLRLVALRILNLTVLRSPWIAELFRKVVVRRLIMGREKTAVTLFREVSWEAGTVTVTDRVVDERPRPGGRLQRGRRLIGTHMASSRYFQEQELQPMPVAWIEDVPWSGRQARHTRCAPPLGNDAATGP
jgi:hypothetical protein